MSIASFKRKPPPLRKRKGKNSMENRKNKPTLLEETYFTWELERLLHGCKAYEVKNIDKIIFLGLNH
jgi:hypothetical protein